MPMQKGMIVRNGVQYGGAVQTIKEEGSESIENFTSYDDDTIYNDFVAPVSTMESGESNTSLFSKISKMFKNIRTIAKNLDSLADLVGSASSASSVSGNDAFSKINTLNTGLSDKVSKAGDTMAGNLTVKSSNPSLTFIDMNGSTERHKVFAGFANSGGDFYIWDNTQNKAVLVSKANSEIYVNGMKIEPMTYTAGNIPNDNATATNKTVKNAYDKLTIDLNERFAFKNGETLNDTDLSSGIYGCYNCPAAPVSGIGTLLVMRYSGDWVCQVYFILSGTPAIWWRTYTNGTTWSNWTKITS